MLIFFFVTFFLSSSFSSSGYIRRMFIRIIVKTSRNSERGEKNVKGEKIGGIHTFIIKRSEHRSSAAERVLIGGGGNVKKGHFTTERGKSQHTFLCISLGLENFMLLMPVSDNSMSAIFIPKYNLSIHTSPIYTETLENDLGPWG